MSTFSTCRIVFRDSANIWTAVIDGEIGDELLAKITANDKTGLIAHRAGWMPARATSTTASGAIVDDGGFEGPQKVRMMGNPLFVRYDERAWAATASPLGFDQLINVRCRPASSTAPRTIEPSSFIRPEPQLRSPSIITMTEHLIIPELLVFSKHLLARNLTAADQALIKKLSKECSGRTARALARHGGENRDRQT
jgi:TRAP-type C4-dicarboxylate transport system substrate-binding protein